MNAFRRIVLLLVCLATLAVKIVPVYLIQPFSAQTEAGIRWAYQLRRVSPWLTVVGTGVLALAVVWRWRHARLWGRGVLIVATLLAAGCAWFTRQNHFEWMFQPVPDVRLIDAGAEKDVAADALVIGVTTGEGALAFPVSRLGYHHLVNTTVGREPIVATY